MIRCRDEKHHVNFSDRDHTYPENLVQKGSLSARTYKRALALLELDRGRTFTDVAKTVGVVIRTASGWADKYKTWGLDFLTDKPRPGRPVTFDGRQRATITALACSDPPERYERRSLRLLADKAGELEYVEAISYVEVGRILKKRTQTAPETAIVSGADNQPVSGPNGANLVVVCLAPRPGLSGALFG